MKQRILVCCGTNCLAAGAAAVLEALQEQTQGLDVEVSRR